jgi:peptidoglycan/xylan/chitin deacetylase (PgdA/CDA1 family)
VVGTSSRRFAGAFWKTIFSYYVNDICLLLFKRPVFYSFTDFRAFKPARSAGNRLLSAAMISLFIVGIGWFIELPFNQLMGTVLAKGPKVKAVALTFDDGPGNSTSAVLDILKRHNAKATFFVIGKNAQANPDLIRRMIREGNEIGNHSYSHSIKLAYDSPSSIKREIDTTSAIIKRLTGLKPTDFRPPHGWRTPWTLRTCHQLGYETVLWTLDSQDWLHLPRERICSNVFKKVKPGAIILMHDRLNIGEDHGMEATVEALPSIIDSLSQLGYTFVTIDEMKSLHRFDDFTTECTFNTGMSSTFKPAF